MVRLFRGRSCVSGEDARGMVSTPVLFDTNILIDYLRGMAPARAECDRHADRAVSIISWMEVMAGSTAAQEADARSFLLNFSTLPARPPPGRLRSSRAEAADACSWRRHGSGHARRRRPGCRSRS